MKKATINQGSEERRLKIDEEEEGMEEKIEESWEREREREEERKDGVKEESIRGKK